MDKLNFVIIFYYGQPVKYMAVGSYHFNKGR